MKNNLKPAKTCKNAKRSPLPADPIGAKFCHWFHHSWKFIYKLDNRWTTESEYPIQLRNLWNMYLDPNIIIGLRFGRDTNYCLLDIDEGSKYHPQKSEENFQQILYALEDIGLCRYILVRSSNSSGIHIYCFLPQSVPTFKLACALKFALEDAGLFLKDGQLEIFPNVKSYGEGKPTAYDGHRLPLQAESWVVNSDLEFVTNDVEKFLRMAELDAAGQDIEALLEAMPKAYNRHFDKGSTVSPSDHNQGWKTDLEEVISAGWTGAGQTNELLRSMVCYGMVFKKLAGKELFNWVRETAINAPGYYQYCNHQHEIEKRIWDWINCSHKHKFYTPYPSKPKRKGNYEQTYGALYEGASSARQSANNIVSFNRNEERSNEARQRIEKAVLHLQERDELPQAATPRAKAIAQTIKQLYGVNVSTKTLYKPQNLRLWHPGHIDERCVIDQPESLLALAEEAKDLAPEELEELITTLNQGIQGNYTPLPYMKVYVIQPDVNAQLQDQGEPEAPSFDSVSSEIINNIPTQFDLTSSKIIENIPTQFNSISSEIIDIPAQSNSFGSEIIDNVPTQSNSISSEIIDRIPAQSNFANSEIIDRIPAQTEPREAQSMAFDAKASEDPDPTAAIRRVTRLRLDGLTKGRKQANSEIVYAVFNFRQKQQRETYWKLRYWWESGEQKLQDLAAQQFCELRSLDTFDPEMIAILQTHAATLGLSRDENPPPIAPPMGSARPQPLPPASNSMTAIGAVNAPPGSPKQELPPLPQIPAPMEAIENQSTALSAASYDNIQALARSIIFCSDEEDANNLWDVVEAIPKPQQEQLKRDVGATAWDKFLNLLPF